VDSIDFGENLIIDGSANYHTREFEIKNNGTAHFYISRLEQKYPADFKVEGFIEVINIMTGKSEWLWSPLFENSSTISNKVPFLIKAKQSMKLRVSFEPENAGVFEDGLIIKTTIRNHTGDTILFLAESMFPPVVNVDTSYLEVYAVSDNVVETKSFELDNFSGGSKLIYSLNIEYKRDVEEKSSSGQSFSAFNLKSAGIGPILQTSNKSGKRTKSANASTELFNRILSYENASEADINLGFGGGFVMKAVTRFTAPDDGFNLSHIQTWYAPGELLNSGFVVNIYDGSKPIGTAKIYSQIVNYKIETPDNDGKLVTVELKKPITFFPGESFYVGNTLWQRTNIPPRFGAN